PLHQLANPQVVRTDALDRADRAAEHVVATAVLPGLLDRHDGLGFLDHTQERAGPLRIPADLALLLFGDVAADVAEADLLLDLDEHLRETAYVGRIGGQHVERDPLRPLGPDAGKAAELIDEVLDDAFVHGRCARFLSSSTRRTGA